MDDVDEKYYLKENKQLVINMWDEFICNVLYKPSFPVWIKYFKEKLSNYNDEPKWKYQIIEKNIKFYHDNKSYLDKWLKKYEGFDINNTNMKFEWQCQNDCSSIKETIIQFRPSGLRVKRPTYIPALVAIKHVPIIYHEGRYRYLTPRECARLQSFPEAFELDKSDEQAYKQFGNSGNVEVVKLVAKHLMKGD